MLPDGSDHDNATELPRKLTASRLQPRRRVSFYDPADPNNKLTALFNPQELTLEYSASYGSLSPIGWSAQHHQYAHSELSSFSLTLWYSRVQAMLRKYSPGSADLDVENPIRFFLSFTKGEYPGEAPRRLLVRWPNAAKIICNVISVAPNLTRFNPDLEAMEYELTVELQPITHTFVSARDLKQAGLHYTDPTMFASWTSNDTGKALQPLGKVKGNR